MNVNEKSISLFRDAPVSKAVFSNIIPSVISMLMVIFILPALLLLCDKPICYTTMGMRKCVRKTDQTNRV